MEKAIVCRATGVVYEEEPTTHRVSPGETLRSVAEQHKLTAAELAGFNCGTLAPDTIAHYLKTVLGAKQPRPDAPLAKGAVVVPRPLALTSDKAERQLELRYWKGWYHLRLLTVVPGAPEFDDDTFTLKSDDGAYESVQTVKDDSDRRNKWLDLEFMGLLPGRKYTLEVDPGGGAKRWRAFEDLSFDELVALGAQAPTGGGGA